MSIELRQNEVIHNEAQFHWTTFLLARIWAGFMSFGVLGGFITMFNESFAGGVGLMVMFGLMGGIPLALAWLRAKNKVYLVTNQRVYIEEGILTKTKKDIPLSKINDILFTQDLVQRMYGAGNVQIMTGNDKPTRVLNIQSPEKFRASISEACNSKVS